MKDSDLGRHSTHSVNEGEGPQRETGLSGRQRVGVLEECIYCVIHPPRVVSVPLLDFSGHPTWCGGIKPNDAPIKMGVPPARLAMVRNIRLGAS